MMIPTTTTTTVFLQKKLISSSISTFKKLISSSVSISKPDKHVSHMQCTYLQQLHHTIEHISSTDLLVVLSCYHEHDHVNLGYCASPPVKAFTKPDNSELVKFLIKCLNNSPPDVYVQKPMQIRSVRRIDYCDLTLPVLWDDCVLKPSIGWLLYILDYLYDTLGRNSLIMGGACTRKRDHLVDEDSVHRITRRYSRSWSRKWPGSGKCPSLMQLCVDKVCQDINKYDTFSVLPRDISQQVFNELVYTKCLTEVSLEAFRDCALQIVAWILDYICGLSNLTTLSFRRNNSITAEGMSALSSLFKGLMKLEYLNIKWCNCITDNDMEPLAWLTNLKGLQIYIMQ